MLQTVDIGSRSLDWIGVDADAPLVTQVSRFDPWKDPLGVLAAYRLVRERVPGLQLALVGSMALDDPEAWDVYREIREASATDALIHDFTNLTGVGRDFFLLPRLLPSEIDLMRSLVESPDAERMSIARDPVCGLLIAGQPVASVVREGRRRDFCSHDCRERFLRPGAAAGGAQPHREE